MGDPHPGALPRLPDLPVRQRPAIADPSLGQDRFGGPVRLREAARPVQRRAVELTGLYEQLTAADPFLLQVSCAGEAIVGWFTHPAGGLSTLSSWPRRIGTRTGPPVEPGVFVVDHGQSAGGGKYAMYWNSLPGEFNTLDPTDVLAQLDPGEGRWGDYRTGTFEIVAPAARPRIRLAFDPGASRPDEFECVDPGRVRLPQAWLDRVQPQGALRAAIAAQHFRPLSARMFHRRLDALLDPAGKPASLLASWATAENPARRMLVPHVVDDLGSTFRDLPDDLGYEAELASIVYERMMRQARTIDGVPRSHFAWYSMAVKEDALLPHATRRTRAARLALLGFSDPEPAKGYAYKISSTKLAPGVTVVVGGGIGGIRFHIRRYADVLFKTAPNGTDWARDDAGMPIPVDPSVFEDPRRGEQLDGGPVSSPYLDGLVYEVGVGLGIGLGGGDAAKEMLFFTNQFLGLDDFQGSRFDYTAVRAVKASVGTVSGTLWGGYYGTFTLTSGRRLEGVRTVVGSSSGPGVPKPGALAKATEGGEALFDELTKLGFSVGQLAHTAGYVWRTGDAHDVSEQSTRALRGPAVGAPAAPMTTVVLFEYDEHRLRERASLLDGDGRSTLESVLATHRIAFEGWTDLGIEVVGHASPEGTTEYNRELSRARADWTAQAILDAFPQRIDRKEVAIRAVGEDGPPRLLDPPTDPSLLSEWKQQHRREVEKWPAERRVDVAVRGRPVLVALSVAGP